MKNTNIPVTRIGLSDEGQWTVIQANTNCLSFPPGQQGEQTAKLAAIGLAVDLAQLVDYTTDGQPELIGRAIRAANLVLAGHVYAPNMLRRDRGEVALVLSSLAAAGRDLAGRLYSVQQDESRPRRLSCNCADYARSFEAAATGYAAPMRDGHVVCKHTLAVNFAFALELELDNAPIPFLIGVQENG